MSCIALESTCHMLPAMCCKACFTVVHMSCVALVHVMQCPEVNMLCFPVLYMSCVVQLL